MKKTWMILQIWIFCLCAIWMPAEVFSQNGIRISRLTIKPSAQYEAQYTDNVFLEPIKVKEDVIHLLKLQVVATYNGGESRFLEAGVDTAFAVYGEYEENNYNVINPFVSAGMRTPAGFYAEANESFAYTEDPYASENQYNLGKQATRWVNYADLMLGYGFGKRYAMELMLANRLERYDEEIHQWQNTIDNRYSLYFLYAFSPKTSAFVQFGQNYVEFDEQNDGIAFRNPDNSVDYVWNSNNSKDYVLTDYTGGLRFSPSGKIRGEVRVGYGTQSFDNGHDPFDRAYEDQASWIAGTSVEYHIRERSVLTGILDRQFLGSPDADAASYIRTLAQLNLGHKFNERFGANAGIGWARSDYEDEYGDRDRKYFNEYMADAGVEFLILRWLSSGVHLSYITKEAGSGNYAYEEYDNARVSVYVKAQL